MRLHYAAFIAICNVINTNTRSLALSIAVGGLFDNCLMVFVSTACSDPDCPLKMIFGSWSRSSNFWGDSMLGTSVTTTGMLLTNAEKFFRISASAWGDPTSGSVESCLFKKEKFSQGENIVVKKYPNFVLFLKFT